ncbi:MAG TPA: DedA family protein [Acidimicrobiia bacterium]|nr:DedA family protein [Acidimicrobiia bacterium]
MLSDLTEWVINVIERLGGVGVALLVAVENIFPPIPSEIVLPFAGVVARRSGSGVVGMIAFATMGSLAGALFLYGVAAAIGPERLKHLVDRHGRWARLTVADIERAESWFDRWATAAVLLGRCVPLIRSLVSIPAGFRRMNLGLFILYTTIGALVWNTALVGGGYLLAEESRWLVIEEILGYVQYLVLAGIGAAIFWYVWRRFLSPTRAKTTP